MYDTNQLLKVEVHPHYRTNVVFLGEKLRRADTERQLAVYIPEQQRVAFITEDQILEEIS